MHRSRIIRRPCACRSLSQQYIQEVVQHRQHSKRGKWTARCVTLVGNSLLNEVARATSPRVSKIGVDLCLSFASLRFAHERGFTAEPSCAPRPTSSAPGPWVERRQSAWLSRLFTFGTHVCQRKVQFRYLEDTTRSTRDNIALRFARNTSLAARTKNETAVGTLKYCSYDADSVVVVSFHVREGVQSSGLTAVSLYYSALT